MKRCILVLAAWTLLQPFCPAAIHAGVVFAPGFCTMVAGLASVDTAPVYRFWSPGAGRHFYTLDEQEKNKLLDQYADVWTYEGVAFRACSARVDENLMPVHRFWSDVLGAHFYTLDETEKDKLIHDYSDVWTYEGIGFHAYPPGRQPAGTVPAYRFWSGGLGTHFYTTSDREWFKLVGGYPGTWTYEDVGWYAWPVEQATLPAFTKGPYVSQVTSDSATILWETDVAAPGAVSCGADSVVESTPVTRHRVVFTGLEPGIAYEYRAASGTADRTGTFHTAPSVGQAFRFAVYGDSRSAPDIHRQVTTGIAAERPDLVFHTGDLVGSGGSYSLWDTEFFGPADGLLLDAPLVPVPGNHESIGPGAPWFFWFFDRTLREAWFAFSYGNTRFIGLDTAVDYSIGSPQYNWLLQELESDPYRAATWHIVLFHQPPFSCTAGHSDDPVVQSQLVPLLESHGVDLAFSGHSHVYERYLYHGISYIVTGGGGAPLHDLVLDVTPPIRAFGLSVHHYCIVDVDPGAQTLTMRAVNLTGRTFDTLVLSK